MEKKFKILSVLAIYCMSLIGYVVFFAWFNPYLNFIIIGSLSLVSTGMLYAIMHESANQFKKEEKNKLFKKPESSHKILNEIPRKALSRSADIVDEYFETLPFIEDYVDSNAIHEQVPIINEVIFSRINQEQLSKIDLLDLSKMEKLQFIRELIYYNPEERENLIESMLSNRDNEMEVIYTAPLSTLEFASKFRVHVISLIEEGEKKKIIIIESL